MIEESDLDEVSVVSDADRSTRWDDRPRPPLESDEEESSEEERGGMLLAAMAALLLPILIVAAVMISAADGPTELEQGDDDPPQRGLDVIRPRVDESATTTSLPVIVDGRVLTSTPDAPAESSLVPGPEPGVEADASVPATSSTAATSTPATTAPLPPTTPRPAPTTSPPTTARPTTTAAPTTSPPTTAAPTTAAPTTAAPTTATPTTRPTTTSAPPPTLPPEPEPEPASPFAQRIEIGQLGDTFVRFRFATASTTGYRVAVFGADRIVATATGTAVAGAIVRESIDGLTPGSDYTVQVILSGPPAFTSPAVAFRTSGGRPEPSAERVEVLNLRVIRTDPTRVELHYESNICANGSFVIRDDEGDIVGRNDGQATGCTTRHLAIPGFWTAPLRPGETYTVTVTVEAEGSGRGDDNTASRSITVTTRKGQNGDDDDREDERDD